MTATTSSATRSPRAPRRRWWPRTARRSLPAPARSSSRRTCSTRCDASASRRGGARTRRSSPSPARSARPAPRRRCGSPSSGSAPTHASVASYNNHWGVPLTLARLPRDAAYGVFEIGMNHAGEIEPLTRMVRPHVAVITTVEPVHIEFFRSISAIADAKGEIFCGIEPGGTAVLNRDNASFERVRAHALASRGRPRRQLRRARERRRARRAHHPQARAVGRRGAGARRAARLPGRRARAPRGDELACGARRREGRRRRSRARGARPCRPSPAGRARRAHLALRRRRRLPPRRRGLQRQPGLDAGGACEPCRDRASAARPPPRGHRRHARARSAGTGAAPRARAGGGRERRRPGLRRRTA